MFTSKQEEESHWLEASSVNKNQTASFAHNKLPMNVRPKSLEEKSAFDITEAFTSSQHKI